MGGCRADSQKAADRQNRAAQNSGTSTQNVRDTVGRMYAWDIPRAGRCGVFALDDALLDKGSGRTHETGRVGDARDAPASTQH